MHYFVRSLKFSLGKTVLLIWENLAAVILRNKTYQPDSSHDNDYCETSTSSAKLFCNANTVSKREICFQHDHVCAVYHAVLSWICGSFYA